ncbi:S8 family peptidase [Nonomuraea sediminis]|uniref:S8 family peptidase n=1 Tax=Nonomuraea sediminis TaxID=2835864 RepID=UPI001BDCD4A2|nr:S8 family serine peptidase [Nonomuraea sediminis]
MSMRRHFAGALVAVAALSSLALTGPTANAAPVRLLPVSAKVAAEAKKGMSRVIVGVKPALDAKTLMGASSAKARSGNGITLVRTIATPTPMMALNVTNAGLRRLRKTGGVLWIREDRRSKAVLDSSTHVIGADKAHAAGQTGTGQTVAVIDTGVDTTHPFLAGRIVAERCFSHPQAPGETPLCPNGTTDQEGAGASDVKTGNCVAGATNLCTHGTHVAGIAAGKKAAGSPADGVAPGASIISVQVFTRGNDLDACPGGAPCVYTYDSDQLAALAWVDAQAAVHHVAAANLSIGLPGSAYDTPCDSFPDDPNPPVANPFKGAVDLLRASGVATVFAAGNDGNAAGVNYPGCVSTGVTVGATNDADAIASFSNRGKVLDFFAPGVDVKSSVPGGGYESMNGTSMAAPHVTGAFAVLKAAYPGKSVDFLEARLRDTGKQITFGSLTRPRIDLFAALPPVSTPTPTPTPTTSGTPTPTHSPTKLHDQVYTGDTTVSDTGTAATECKRGHAKKPRTAAQWAASMKSGRSGAVLACYLKIAGTASKVFDEKVAASTPAQAYPLLAAGKLDGQLLAAWLNYASGARNLSTKVTSSTTFAKAVKIVEGDRLNPKTPAAKLAKDAAYLAGHVNK